MARMRRSQAANAEAKEKGTNSSSSNGSNFTTKNNKTKDNIGLLSYWKHVIGFACFAIAATVGYMGYLETRVNTPFDEKKVIISILKSTCLFTAIYSDGGA